MRHLTDEEIQAYLDGIKSGRAEIKPSHLDSCHHCRERLRQFEILYERLAIDETPALSGDFARQVARQARKSPVAAPQRGLRPVLVTMLTALLGVLAISFPAETDRVISFLGLGVVLNYFEVSFIPAVRGLFGHFGVNTTFIVSTVMAIIATIIIDYVIGRYRQRMASFLV